MLESQVLEIRNKMAKSQIKGIIGDDMPYIRKFYEDNKDIQPTDLECEKGLRFLNNNVKPITMIWFAEAYSYSLPQLQIDYPNLKKAIERHNIPASININYSKSNNDYYFGS